MIVANIPYRISLLGGSTDLSDFIIKYGKSSIVNMSINKYSECILNDDIILKTIDFNKKFENFPVVKCIYNYYGIPKFDVNFKSSLQGFGTGLATSSASIVGLIHCIHYFLKKSLNYYDICQLAHNFEKEVSPNVGFQDPYGCGISGIKQISYINGNININMLNPCVIHGLYFYLLNTNIKRTSTKYLTGLDFESRKNILHLAEEYIDSDYDQSILLENINKSYSLKKYSSDNLLTSDMVNMEQNIVKKFKPTAYKLCGAGGGGFYLLVNKTQIIDSELEEVKLTTNPIELILI